MYFGMRDSPKESDFFFLEQQQKIFEKCKIYFFIYICPPKLDTQIVSFKYEAIPSSSKNVNMFNMLF